MRHRPWARLRHEGSTTAWYAYDGAGKRVSETVSEATTRNTYDVNRSLPVLLQDGERTYVWGLGLAYSVDNAGGAIRVYHTDGLGSVRALTDATGSVVQTLATDEFGAPTQTQGTGDQPFGYAGERRDAETVLQYLRARMYDPRLGRFLQRDPVAKAGPGISGWNRYAYVGNNPVSFRDPSGLAAAQNNVMAQAPPGPVCPPVVGPCKIVNGLLVIAGAAIALLDGPDNSD